MCRPVPCLSWSRRVDLTPGLWLTRRAVSGSGRFSSAWRSWCCSCFSSGGRSNARRRSRPLRLVLTVAILALVLTLGRPSSFSSSSLTAVSWVPCPLTSSQLSSISGQLLVPSDTAISGNNPVRYLNGVAVCSLEQTTAAASWAQATYWLMLTGLVAILLGLGLVVGLKLTRG